MKRLGMMMAAGLLFAAVGANAQTKQGEQEVGLNLGLAIPTSQISIGGSNETIGSTGLDLGFNYDYMVLSHLSIGGDFTFRDFGNNSINFGPGGRTADLSATDWTLMLTGKYQFMPDNQFRPYALLGLGLGNASVTLTGQSGASGSGFAYAIGAGAEYDVNAMWAVGAELRWSGLAASLNNGVGSQDFNSFDLIVSGHYKFGI